MAESMNVVDLQQQKSKIKMLMNNTLKVNDTWYLIEAHWFKKWQMYVSYDSFSNSILSPNNMSNNPGPIDNSSLFQPNSSILKPSMTEEHDYFLLPEEAWKLLVNWYSIKDEQTPLARQVINEGIYKKNLKIEIYYLELKLSLYSNVDNFISKEFSLTTTVEEMQTKMRELFNILAKSEVRLWIKWKTNSFEELKKPSATLQEAALYNGQIIVLEEKGSNGVWPYENKFGSNTSKIRLIEENNCNDTPSYSSMFTPGLCGLTNLGNTCFMNSAIQCMSNVSILTEYMLSDRWKAELNKDNPLGMHGEVASSYAELIRNMWSGRQNCTVPRSFKFAVGRFKPEFSGFQQQDSQELMAFLLDGLHEDLNRIKKKPYIEAKQTDDRPDEDVAEETWADYNKRNNSIIFDTFHGLLKSTLICPECSKVSVKFDPFCYLSLPLPMKKERQVDVFFVALDPLVNIRKCKLTMQKLCNISDLCAALTQFVPCPANRMIVADVYNNRFHKLFSHNDPLSGISDRDDIYVYEIPPDNAENPHVIISVYMREIKKNGIPSSSQLFGLPLLMPIPRNNCSYNLLYNTIKERIKKYIKLPIEEHSIQNGIDNKDENKMNDIMDDDEDFDYDSDERKSSSVDKKSNNKQKETKIFELRHVNAFGSADFNEFHRDDRSIHFAGHAYIATDWLSSDKEKYFDEKALEMIDIDDSMLNKPVVKKTTHLSDCLKLFTTTEQLGEHDLWYCPVCKMHKQATKKFDIWSLPRVLVIHLKRFSYNRYLRDKLDTHIDYPIEGLTMDGFVVNATYAKITYNLIAVSNHYGGLGGGHYTAYAKNRIKKKWYHFDDSNVSEVSEKDIVTKAGYVLVYEAVNWPTMKNAASSMETADAAHISAAPAAVVDSTSVDDDEEEMDTGSSS